MSPEAENSRASARAAIPEQGLHHSPAHCVPVWDVGQDVPDLGTPLGNDQQQNEEGSSDEWVRIDHCQCKNHCGNKGAEGRESVLFLDLIALPLWSREEEGASNHHHVPHRVAPGKAPRVTDEDAGYGTKCKKLEQLAGSEAASAPKDPLLHAEAWAASAGEVFILLIIF